VKHRGLMSFQTISAVAVCLTLGANVGYAGPTFYATTDASEWQVATNVGGTDGEFSSFPTTGFETATAVTGRFSGTTGWIANNSTGTNGYIGDWTFFVFRQTFTLTAAEAASANLQFQWAADDSGQGFAERGTWVPAYSLNGGSLVQGVWPGGYSYDLSSTVAISSGFVAGVNTLEFYVEGNGVTDGLAVNSISFTSVPEPSSFALLGVSVVTGLGYMWRRRRIGGRAVATA
jgi:hypothetical protein